VGDEVEFEVQKGDGVLVSTLLPRRNALSREMTFSGKTHVLAANLDRIFVVVAPNPRISPGIIDRFMAVAFFHSIPVVLVANKRDLHTEEDEAILDIYRRLGWTVVVTRADRQEGVKALLGSKGEWDLLAGHSGVGKTSVVNALDPGAEEMVKEVEAQSGKGRHATSFAKAHRLPNGQRLIDTAGIREFAVGDVHPWDLQQAWPEMMELAPDCAMRACTHIHEPKCVVQEAAHTANSSLHPKRYESYVRLFGQMEKRRRTLMGRK